MACDVKCVSVNRPYCYNGFALNWTVFIVCVITVLSSGANQFLLQAKVRQRYSDDDVCFLIFYSRRHLFCRHSTLQHWSVRLVRET